MFNVPNHYSVNISSGIDGVASGAVEVWTGKGVNIRYLDIPYSILFQEPSVGILQIDMPLLAFPAGISFCQTLHREARLHELLVHLVAYLETIQRYARPYYSTEVFCPAVHQPKCFLYDAPHCSSPSGMNGGNQLSAYIINQHRDAVGRLYGYAQILLCRYDCIRIRHFSEGIHPADVCTMRLSGDHYVVGTDCYAITLQADFTGIHSWFRAMYSLPHREG